MGLIEQIAEMRAQEAEERTSVAKDKNFVTNLLLNSNHSVEEIASFAGVSISFVEQVKENLCTK